MPCKRSLRHVAVNPRGGDQLVDLVRDSNLIARTLAVMPQVLCALRGCGIVQVPRFHVEADLNAGRLVELLAPWPSPSMTLSALYPHRRQLSPRVRVFVDGLSQLYAQRFGVGVQG